jgi:type I restriction enzyme R subunit
MWLTGFDVPSLHTMYLDKPMQGHGLMQAIARVNRVDGDLKKGGLVVDYLGLAWHLQQAVAAYTQSGGKGNVAIDQQEAADLVQREYEICRGLFHGFDYSAWRKSDIPAQKQLIANACDHIAGLENGKQRLLQTVSRLSQAFALAVPHPSALAIRDDVGFFQAVRAAFVKANPDHELTTEEIEQSIRQMLSRAVASDEVIDIFAAAGLKQPDVSILSDEFLAEVAGLPQRNLAVELLRKLLNDEIRLRQRVNLVQARSFREMLERTINAYQNRSLETSEIIAELVKLAREMRESNRRGEALGLSEAELAFYDALEVNDSAVKILGDDVLKGIARELVEKVRANVSIDWTARESVRAKLRALVKRTLRNHGYPPDKAEKATDTVLEQAELLAGEWAEG